MIVRRATVPDVLGIADIHVSAWRKVYEGILPRSYLDGLSVAEREALWNRIVSQGRSHVLVAEEDGEILGWIGYGHSRDDDAPDATGEIYALYVAPSRWSTGVGRALWTEAQQGFLDLGFARATLWVLSANERAIRFYRRAGFRECRETEKLTEIGGTSLPELRFEITLGNRHE